MQRSSCVVDLLNGMPSIIIGLFVFGLLVAGHHQSGFAGAVALSIIMLPLVARSTQEMLLLVPQHMRDAADALGVSRWRAVIGVVLPSAAGGIVTGDVLAVARAAGETAPLLFACSIFANTTSVDLFGAALPNIPVTDLHRCPTRPTRRPRARMGRGARAARVHPAREHRRADVAGPQPDEADAMTRHPAWPPGIRRGPGCARRRARTARGGRAASRRETIFDVRDMSVYYGAKRAIAGVDLSIHRNVVTALIGPSGCGKTTFLRSR